MIMNREVKRVPMDFDWPLNKTWWGYLLYPEMPDGAKGNKWEDVFDEYTDENRIPPYKPPTGEGYQCWETTSEGSPITPIFKTFDALCKWLEDNPRGITKSLSKEDWKEALKSGLGVIDIHTGQMAKLEKKGD